MPAFTFTLPAAFEPGHYTACYLLAVATYQLLLLHEGWRRGFALRPWLLMQAATLLAFVVGCKLVVLPLAEWPALWRGGADLGTYPIRSALGGIAASSLVLLALRRWLGLGWAAFDAFVLPLGLGLAVQCLGCLAAGCCWGEPAGAHGLGLCFGSGTGPYLTQMAQGLLPAGAAHALPVVPTQLYALLVCLAVAAFAGATRRRSWPAGTRYLLGTGAVLLAWAVLCQWRDPASQTLGAQPLTLLGVRLLAVQWAVLAAAAAHLAGAGWLLRRSELVPRSSASPRVSCPEPGLTNGAVRPARQLAGAAGLLALTAALAPHALTGAEFRVLQMALGTVLLAEVAACLPALSTASGRWQPRLGLAAALGLLVLMSQAPAPTAPPDSARALDISFGGVQGGFDQETSYREGSSGCGGGSKRPPSRTLYVHHYQALSARVAYQLKPLGEGALSTVGLGVSYGTDEVSSSPQPLSGPVVLAAPATLSRYELVDINPFAEGSHYLWESHPKFAVGYHAGLHFGNLIQTDSNPDNRELKSVYQLLPDAMFWIGNRQVLYAQIDAGYGTGSLGTHFSRMSLGSGLGSRRGGNAQLGLTLASYNPFGLRSNSDVAETTTAYMVFAAANFRVPHTNFSLEPNYTTDFGRSNQMSLRLHYRLKLR